MGGAGAWPPHPLQRLRACFTVLPNFIAIYPIVIGIFYFVFASPRCPVFNSSHLCIPLRLWANASKQLFLIDWICWLFIDLGTLTRQHCSKSGLIIRLHHQSSISTVLHMGTTVLVSFCMGHMYVCACVSTQSQSVAVSLGLSTTWLNNCCQQHYILNAVFGGESTWGPSLWNDCILDSDLKTREKSKSQSAHR